MNTIKVLLMLCKKVVQHTHSDTVSTKGLPKEKKIRALGRGLRLFLLCVKDGVLRDTPKRWRGGQTVVENLVLGSGGVSSTKRKFWGKLG